jgi:hypothetical protein
MSNERVIELTVTDRPDIVRASIRAVCSSRSGTQGVEVESVVEYVDGQRWVTHLDFWPGYIGQPCGGWTLNEPAWLKAMWDRVLGKYAAQVTGALTERVGA